MFELDDNFLASVGLADMPDDQKDDFLQGIYEELQRRVGMALSEGLTSEQMTEFEAFVDQDVPKVRSWFAEHLPNYAEQKDYQSIQESAPTGTDTTAILCEYGSLKWLELNRPDFRDVVGGELGAIREEIRASSPSLLSAIKKDAS